MMVSWLFYALLLYRLLRRVNSHHAMTMLVLVVASVSIFMLNQVNLFALLPLALGRQHEQVSLFLELHRFGNSVAAIFFGLWLFPLGLLVYRSGFLPRFLGILLIVGTLGYLILFVEAFFYPGSERTLWSNPFLVVTHLSELALLLWLLIRGVNLEQWRKWVAGLALTLIRFSNCRRTDTSSGRAGRSPVMLMALGVESHLRSPPSQVESA
jgi:hypothetical protein